MKATSFHITLAAISVKEGELEHVMAKTQKATSRFLDLLKEKHGFLLTCRGAGFGDHGSFWLKINLGEELCCILREYLDDELEAVYTKMGQYVHSYGTLFNHWFGMSLFHRSD